MLITANNHSIWFENPSMNGLPPVKINTLLNYDLVSDGRPDVASPELKTNYVNIPGADGSLDYTEVLNGRKYQNRKGSWEFYVLNDRYTNNLSWSERWRQLMHDLHGRHFERIWLTDEGKYDEGTNEIVQWWYYTGRIYVNEWKSDPQFSKVVLDYELEPYKNRDPESLVEDWKWRDLFNSQSVNPIRYGTFSVNSSKKRTIVNDTGNALPVTASCTADMKLIIGDDKEHPITLTSDDDTTFEVGEGNILLTFTGNGLVTLTYDGSTRSL